MIVRAAQEMSQLIQLISTDFDGTVHSDSELPPIPTSLEERLADLQACGTKWMINTGRDLPGLMECLARARLSLWPDYLGLVEREIYVRDGHEYHPCRAWNERCTSEHDRLFDRIRQDMPQLMKQIEARHQATLYEDSFSPFCMIAANNAEADAIMILLEDYCRKVPGLVAVRNDIYARLSHVGYNKGTVVAEVSRQLGIDRSVVFAAGDHLNDLPMLNSIHAAMVAAPHNAIPEVKQLIREVGGYQSSRPWGHGVLDALDHFLS